MTVRIEVQNVDELIAQLDGLSAELKRDVFQDAMMDGARVVQRAARALAPQKTGALRRAIRVRTLKKREARGQIGAVVDFNSKIARYAHIVEGGAKAHVIKPETKKALKFGGAYMSRVNHPGFKGKDFLENAWRTTQRFVEDKIARSITLSVAKIAARRGLK